MGHTVKRCKKIVEDGDGSGGFGDSAGFGGADAGATGDWGNGDTNGAASGGWDAGAGAAEVTAGGW
ncbi:uncharacterized protein K452DRAFT_289840 [Aplosporella prunicola CBS 121167]|uniref:Uncharacterized protein n=1 Tax=Aplosporella prunicola CBS 121167 TaxID=1176127 RepID=A0A6A6B8U1_9PEZI|nr:uncharacterized protein K452DRAFT_289840 [Aplosporella prunicola CBS 121167]KAF2139287.1 hypothetical protein K452DRAFT_289840 [Aplosporella prunicola CBS 121167]